MKLRCIKVEGETETIAGEYTTTHAMACNLKLLVVKTHAQADDLYALLERVRDSLSDPSQVLLFAIPPEDDISMYRFEADVPIDERSEIITDDERPAKEPEELLPNGTLVRVRSDKSVPREWRHIEWSIPDEEYPHRYHVPGCFGLCELKDFVEIQKPGEQA